MSTGTINTPVLNTYWRTIRNWNDTMKIALISKISASLLKQKKKTNAKLGTFFGVLKNDDFPSSQEIRKIMIDDAQDINEFVI